MKTRCPECNTSFGVTSTQLNVRNGKVRCGVCSTVFNAFDHAENDEPDFPVLQAESERDQRFSVHSEAMQVEQERPFSQASSVAAPSGRPADAYEDENDDYDAVMGHERDVLAGDRVQASPDVTRRRDQNRRAGERFVVSAPSLSGSGAYHHDRRGAASQDTVEGQYRRRVQRDTEYDDPERSSGSGLIWFLAVVFALVVLFAQGAVVFRNQIANVAPNLRPQLVQLCSFVGCQVGYSRSVRHLAILKPALRQVNTPVATADTRSYTLQAIIKNNDAIAQPFPSLVLSLKNASESVSARRVIKPEEYLLPDAQKRAFEPNDEISIRLPVQVTRTDVAGFELSLFYP